MFTRPETSYTMTIPPDHDDHYQTLLSLCTSHDGVVALLQHYRPYLETIPSLRRPQDSMEIGRAHV